MAIKNVNVNVMEIDSKYNGSCGTCGKPYRGQRRDKSGELIPGDRIEWSKEGGTHHIECYNASPTLEEYFDANAVADKLGFAQPGELSANCVASPHQSKRKRPIQSTPT
jgi:hypothetical protein